MVVSRVLFASTMLLGCDLPSAAQSITTEVDVTAGYSTQDVTAGSTQVRAFGDVGRGWRFYADATWADVRGTASDVFGTAYPYDGRVRPMESYVEKTVHSGRRLTGVRIGRYRTPFGIHSRGDHAYNGFLRPPMIRYSGYPALSNTFLETGVDVIAGTPRLHGEVSVGVAKDEDPQARRAGLNGVLRMQSSSGPWIVGASYIRTRPSVARGFATGHTEFAGVDVRWMASGVQLRGEWIAGRPFDGARASGGYLDAIVHRPRMGPVTAVARVERFDFSTGGVSPFARRYTVGAKVRLSRALVSYVNIVRRNQSQTPHPGYTALDVGFTLTKRP